MSLWRTLSNRLNKKLCIYIVSLLIPIVISPLAASPHKEARCAFVMILMGCYWFLEPVSIVATALLPVVLFPIMGIVSSTEICLNYMKETFMMFIGGLLMAVAVEECRLHERIALKILLFIGTEIKWLMMGFMLTTMFLSMWVSNTATTAMMVPIVEAVVSKISSRDIPLREKMLPYPSAISLTESKQVDDPEDVSDENVSKTPSSLKVALLLSVCYAANIGGTGTLTGTGPNLVFKGLLEELHPDSNEITFASWMLYNVPGMVLCVLIGWFYLWLVYIKCSNVNHNLASKQGIRDIISKRYAELGSVTCHEAEVMILFMILVLLWIFREPKFVTGWGEVIGSDKKIGDSVPAIAVAFLLFFIPSNIRDLSSRPILEWRTAQTKLPWGVILLCGGGFALADGAQKSGLSEWVGVQLSALQVLSPAAIVAIVCFMTAMVTEIVTNTTTATILLPIFNQMAIAIGFNPLFIMLPAAVVCSYAFMLPVATPPNAIAFESGHMQVIQMAKPGLVMNLVCCGVQMFMLNTLGVALFDLNTFPSWSKTDLTSSVQNETFSSNFTTNSSSLY